MISPSRLLASAAAFAAAVALTTPASADPPPADSRAEARAHFLRGQEHQQAGRYDDAIAEYQAAYSAAPMPALLFNLGQAYRLKGDKHRAVAYYKKYVAAEPNAAPSIEAQQHIDSLAADLAAEAQAINERARAGDEQAAKGQPLAPETPDVDPPRQVAEVDDAPPDDPEPAVLHATARPHASTRGRLGARLRADIDGQGCVARLRSDDNGQVCGAMLTAGVAFSVTHAFELELDAMLGTQLGGYLGASLYLGNGTWRPMISAGAPLLVLDGAATPGAHGAAGLRWDPIPRFALFVTAGAFWFPSVPAGYQSLVWVPSLGTQLTF